MVIAFGGRPIAFQGFVEICRNEHVQDPTWNQNPFLNRLGNRSRSCFVRSRCFGSTSCCLHFALMSFSCSFHVAFIPQTGLPVWGSYSFQRVASLGRMIWPLSPPLHPTLGALGRMSLHWMSLHLSPPCLPLWVPSPCFPLWVPCHLSPSCLPLWAPWAAWVYTCLPLVSRTCLPLWCLGPHEFTLVSLLSPSCLPLVSLLSPTLGAFPLLPNLGALSLVSFLSPTLGALGRMSLHMSPTCLPHLSPTLVSHSGCLGPHEFTLVSLLSPTLGALGRMSLHLSPTCLPLWVPWASWAYTCLPHLSPTRVSHSGFLGPHDFTLVSPLPPTLGALGRMSLHLSPTCLPLVSHTCFPHLPPTLGSLGRMSLHLSPTCLPLWVPWAAWVYSCLPLSPTVRALGRMNLHLSPTCLPQLSPTLVSHSGCLGPHEFTLVCGDCLQLVSHSGCLGPHEFTLVSPFSHSGWLGPHEFTLVSNLSLTLGCLGPHEFTRVFHSSPTLVSHSGCLGPHEFTLVSH